MDFDVDMSQWTSEKKCTTHRCGCMIMMGWIQQKSQPKPIFQQLKQQGLIDKDVAFQVGIPTASAISLIGMSLLDGFRYRSAMDERLAKEVAQIVQDAGKDNVLIQVEIGMENTIAWLLPSCLHSFLVRWVMNSCIGFLRVLGLVSMSAWGISTMKFHSRSKWKRY